ncbi:MAG: allantoate deiminase [Bacillus sp. (in: firmicutes)]
MMAIRIEKNDVATMIEWLASNGKTSSGGVTRLLYSPAWMDAQKALKKKMESIGLQASFDHVGNLFGKLQGTDLTSKTILTGSHVDTVVDGGKYDGSYGIIASLLAVERLKKQFGKPKKTIEVVSLCEEEGSRFPLTFWGSRNIQGSYSLDDVIDLKDSEGVSFLEAMTNAGFDSHSYSPPIRTDLERFIEVHIEQGMVLENNQKSIGIVTHIVGQRRFMITLLGESNHVGTTPMAYRKDPMTLASDFICYLTKKAQEVDPTLVASIGKIIAKPNVPNVIIGELEMSLDVRHHDESTLSAFCDMIFAYLNTIAKQSAFTVNVTPWTNVKPVEMCQEMNATIEEIVKNKNIPYQSIVSGAGHDSQVFGSICPTSLIFVPSKKGISHSPQEQTDVEDLERGIDVLTEILYQLAY